MAVSGLVELQCQMEKAMNTSKEYILLLHFMPFFILHLHPRNLLLAVCQWFQPEGGSPYSFSTCALTSVAEAQSLFEHLAKQGILARLFEDTALVRIGIPDDGSWSRFEDALKSWKH